MKVWGGQIVRRQTKQRSPETAKEKRMPRLQSIEKTPVSSSALPRRSGLRPKTIRGPLHVQCTGHGDPNLLHHVIQEVLYWPQIESTAPFVGDQDTVSIRRAQTMRQRSSVAGNSLVCFSKHQPFISLCLWYALIGRSFAGGPNRTILHLTA